MSNEQGNTALNKIHQESAPQPQSNVNQNLTLQSQIAQQGYNSKETIDSGQQTPVTAQLVVGSSAHAPINDANNMTSNSNEIQQTSTDQIDGNQAEFASTSTTNIKPLISNEESEETSGNGEASKEIAVPMSESQPSRTVTKVKLATELDIFDWFRNTDIINQIAERTKNTVDSVITTLDPGMKEYLYSGGNINIIVISDSTTSISPIRNSFQSVFGRATVSAASSATSQFQIKLACGLQEARMVAKERISILRSDTSKVAQNQVILVLQPTLVDWSTITSMVCEGEWFLTYCMFIEDPVLGLFISSFSQFIPIDSDIIVAAKETKFPEDFQHNHLGFAISIDELMSSKINLNAQDNCSWMRTWTSLDETQVIDHLSFTLANQYKRKWEECVHQ